MNNYELSAIYLAVFVLRSFMIHVRSSTCTHCQHAFTFEDWLGSGKNPGPLSRDVFFLKVDIAILT